MLPAIQERYAKTVFSDDKYRKFLSDLNKACDIEIQYRVAEMPIFVSHDFRKKLEEAAAEIIAQCTSPAYLKASEATLEPEYTVPNQPEKPLFAVVDFAVTQDEAGNFHPRLIELQGFPSLYGYQYFFAKTIRENFSLGDEFSMTFSGLGEEEYIKLLRRAIIGDQDPESVALLEYAPEKQKTRPDFLALKKLIGIEETDICSVKKDGRTLYHKRNGCWVPIKRIFNRAIVDELSSQGVELPFSWTDEIDTEWAGHPNWYFRISKFALPYLRHESVPSTRFLSELGEIPPDLENYVLKPLYSFAGKGVNVFPKREDIEQIPAEQKEYWVLQEKVRYAECVYTPEGMNKLELRVMMLWLPEWEKPLPVMSLVRTGRGPMMNVNYNSIPWTGSSGCLFAEG